MVFIKDKLRQKNFLRKHNIPVADFMEIKDRKDIESAVEKLSKNDLSKFRAWFEEFDAKVWDMQFEEDASTGKLDKVSEQALSDYKAGKCKKI